MEKFDSTRACLEGPNLFPRFSAPEQGLALSAADLPGGDYLQILERGGQRRGLLVRQMSFHHLAEGTLCAEPWAVSF